VNTPGEPSWAANHLGKILTRCRQAAERTAGDAELLGRFFASGDESAFEVLVWRHGPMVLNVCRRLLRHEHGRGGRLPGHVPDPRAQRRRDRPARHRGRWLYRVAFRVALRVRDRQAKWPAPLDPAREPAHDGRSQVLATELRGVLDDEVNRFAGALPAAFVCGHLEGRTREQAARELGCHAAPSIRAWPGHSPGCAAG